jgi:hypothetical protein
MGRLFCMSQAPCASNLQPLKTSTGLWTRPSFVLVGLILFFACTAGKNTLGMHDRRGEKAVIYTTGSVMNVIRGVAPAPEEWIALSPFRAGFEAGSPLGIGSIGEFISFNGIGYSKSTQPGVGYYRLIQGPKIITNGALFVSKETKPSFLFEVTTPIELDLLFDELYKKAQGPFCFAAAATLRRYHATALASAPIRGQNIFDHRNIYYAQKPIDESNVPAGLMGCVALPGSLKDPRMSEGLGAVLYNNPMDPSKGLVTHTHSLRLSKAVNSPNEIAPSNAVDVHHLFTDSVIDNGRFEIFVIGGFTEVAKSR